MLGFALDKQGYESHFGKDKWKLTKGSWAQTNWMLLNHKAFTPIFSETYPINQMNPQPIPKNIWMSEDEVK